MDKRFFSLVGYGFIVIAMLAIAVSLIRIGADIVDGHQKGGDLATWVGAIGTVGALCAAIYLARRGDVQRRQEPILALSAILRRAEWYSNLMPIADIPIRMDLVMFFATVDRKAIEGIQRALEEFPLDRLMDYASIDALFEMQGAMRSLKEIIVIAEDPEDMWQQAFFLNKFDRDGVRVKVGLAMAYLQQVRDGAGIRFR